MTTPGPGNYEAKSSLGNSPNFSFRGRYDGTNKASHTISQWTHSHSTYNNPGPGHYSTPTHNVKHYVAPAFRVGTGGRGIFLDEIKTTKVLPGPGNYNVRGKEEGPQWSFGNDKRSREMKGGSPGPG